MLSPKNTAPVLWLILAVSVFICGIIVILNVNLAWWIIETSVIILTLLVGMMYLISIFLKSTENRLRHLGVGALCILGSLVLFTVPQLIEGTFNLVVGMLGILIGLFVLINSIKLKRDGASWVGNLLVALVYVFLGIEMAFSSREGRLFSLFFGTYLILFSLNVFSDALVSLMGSNTSAQKAKKRIRISMPVIFAAFLPIKLLKKVNRLVEEDPDALLLLPDQTDKQTADLTIYIHTREGLINGVGHVDICIDGLVYSYGNYDSATWKFGGFLADGVMVEMDSKAHIKQALEVENKILMAYGLSLTPDHKKAVKTKLGEIINELTPWDSLAEQNEKGAIDGKQDDYSDIASQLYKSYKAKFYKFKFGNPFKTYYAMGTNCVKLADMIVGKSGINLLKVNGIITPGSYLDYLDRLYERGDSIVISRTLYKK